MDLPLYIQDIMKILPHRYPFLLVDKIIELELGKRAVGIKCVTGNEEFFIGHFPERPIMPGVLIIEAIAQVGGVLALLTIRGDHLQESPVKQVYFMGIDNARFRRPVVPGDQLRLEVQTMRAGSKVWKLKGTAYVDGDLVAEAEILASLG